MTADPVKRVSGAKLLVALVAAEFTVAFETSMIFAALATLIRHFGSATNVGWLVTIYLLVSAGSAAVVGRFGDIFGRRKVLLMLVAVAGIGSLVSGLTGSLAVVIVGRALQGLSGAILPLCCGIAREALPARRVPFAIGVVLSAAAIGTGAGLVLGAWIVEHMGWQAMFHASAAMAAVAFVLVWIIVPKMARKAPGPAQDVAGGLLFVPAVAAILLAISQAHAWGWTDPRILACWAAGVLLMALWVWRSLSQPYPLIDVRLLKRREVLLANLCMALAALGTFQCIQVISLLMEQPAWTGGGLGLSATLAGVFKLPSTIASVLVAPLAGWLLGRLGARWTLVSGSVLALCAWIGFAALPWSPATVVLFLSLATIGGTTLYTSVSNVLAASVPEDRTSEVVGMMIVIRAACQSIGAQTAAVMLAAYTVVDATHSSARFPSHGAYVLTFGIYVALSSIGVAAAWLMPRGLSAPVATSAPGLLAAD